MDLNGPLRYSEHGGKCDNVVDFLKKLASYLLIVRKPG
jgi:hypothetical protein